MLITSCLEFIVGILFESPTFVILAFQTIYYMEERITKLFNKKIGRFVSGCALVLLFATAVHVLFGTSGVKISAIFASLAIVILHIFCKTFNKKQKITAVIACLATLSSYWGWPFAEQIAAVAILLITIYING